MLKEYMVKYEFSAEQGLSATDFMHVRVGFTTKKKQGILLQLQDATNSEYISLEVNNAGKYTTDFSYHGNTSWRLIYIHAVKPCDLQLDGTERKNRDI